MLAWRLLGSYPGARALTDQPFTLNSAPQGGGVISPDPRSYYHNGKTHFAWVNGSSGEIELATYDHATQTRSVTNGIADLGTPDTHDTPAIMVRSSDEKLVAAFSRVAGAQMWIRVSANANDTGGAWPAATNIDSQLGGTAYTYPSLVQLRGVVNDPIYLFYRNTVSGTTTLCYSISTDGGATWAAQTQLFRAGVGVEFVSWRIGSDWDTRIDIVVDDKDSYSQDPSLYHFYIDGTDGSLHESDGTTIVAGLPIGTGDVTLIHDGDVEGGGRPGGTVLVGGVPSAVYFVKVDATHNAIRRAKWNGAAWDVETIVASAGVHPADRFSTGLTIAFDDPDTVYLGNLVSGTVEVFRYRKSTTWAATQLTESSPAHNAQVQTVHFGASTMPVLWFQGTLTSSFVFSLGTMGLRPT